MRLLSPGEFAKGKVQSVQDYVLLAVRSITNLFRPPQYLADTIQQADMVGVGSLPIVLSACFFTGAALALNSAATLGRFGALTLIGQLVSIGIVRELGPVLAGLVVAGQHRPQFSYDADRHELSNEGKSPESSQRSGAIKRQRGAREEACREHDRQR